MTLWGFSFAGKIGDVAKQIHQNFYFPYTLNQRKKLKQQITRSRLREQPHLRTMTTSVLMSLSMTSESTAAFLYRVLRMERNIALYPSLRDLMRRTERQSISLMCRLSFLRTIRKRLKSRSKQCQNKTGYNQFHFSFSFRGLGSKKPGPLLVL